MMDKNSDKMNHQVFISYSESDHQVADMICSALEQANIRCWIAPRDIPPGHRWGDLMFNAVEHCKILILVLSANTEKSQWVTDELTLAMGKNKEIIPFQIENFSPKRGIIKGLKVRSQWINAYSQPLQDAIDHLVNSVRKDLDIEREKTRVRITTEEIVVETSIFKKILRRKSIWVFTFLIIAVLLTIIGPWKKDNMELQSKGLKGKIIEAKAYYDAGNIDGKNKALKLYREVVTALSQKARQALNQELLDEAESDFKKKFYDDALRKYVAVFKEYYQ